MRYQLVLQWPSKSSADYEKLIETEDLLVNELPSGSEVDGHDAGSGEVNIFILTNDPLLSFQQVRSILEKGTNWTTVRVAYREVGGSNYTILWPMGLTEFKIA
jgi:hypothetical protein